jgi:hypothetical protein
VGRAHGRLRPRRLVHRPGAGLGVRPLDIGYQEAGDNGLLRRCLLRPLARNYERRPLHARNRLLSGVHGTGDPQGQAASLRLPRDARQSAPDRELQSKDRPAARSRGLPGSVPVVRRRPRGPARDRTPSRALVRRIERPRSSKRRVRQTTTVLGGEDCDLLFMLLLSNRNENDLEYWVMQQD